MKIIAFSGVFLESCHTMILSESIHFSKKMVRGRIIWYYQTLHPKQMKTNKLLMSQLHYSPKTSYLYGLIILTNVQLMISRFFWILCS